jgi:hypothetical protein
MHASRRPASRSKDRRDLGVRNGTPSTLRRSTPTVRENDANEL